MDELCKEKPVDHHGLVLWPVQVGADLPDLQGDPDQIRPLLLAQRVPAQFKNQNCNHVHDIRRQPQFTVKVLLPISQGEPGYDPGHEA